MNCVKYITAAAIACTASILSACAGNTPGLDTHPDFNASGTAETAQTTNSGTTTDPAEASSAQQPGAHGTADNGTTQAVSDNVNSPTNPTKGTAQDNAKTAAPQSASAQTSSGSTDGTEPGRISPDSTQLGPRSENQTAPDPYTAIPEIVNATFAYADTLYKMDLTDSATAYLERFRVIKPLWAQWEATADSMLNEFGKTRAEKAKAFEPAILEIQNMNRAGSAYSLVAEAVDSLIARAPGDSIINWAKEQKAISRENTLKRAMKEKDEILEMANGRGLFEDAMKKAQEFQMRYRSFEEELNAAQLIAYIDKLSNDVSEDAKKYWESHDPAAALAQADSLMKANKFSEAKEILNKLKASTLRKEANAKYQELADSFCNAKRKVTSQMFAKAQKQKDPEKRRDLLQKAIEPLNACIDEYAEYEKIKTVLENKTFLEKELER